MKKWMAWFPLALLLWMIPIIAYAAGDENPMDRLKKFFKFNWAVIDNLGFAFYLIMVPITIFIFVLLVWTVVGLISFFYKVNKGEKNFKDKDFWIRTGAIILFVFLIVSGALFDFLGNIYEWTVKLDIGSGGDA
ncbi:hypothetical protein ABEW34_21555 [Paenibacillus algorifonticola]|uniref:hypothetical protein n=1 Tax=Paenibacillus algorifonticola TaxID=684063 RepID=UPI003D26AECD